MKYIFLSVLLFTAVQTYGQVITTVAGNDTSGFSGDGGPATAAKMTEILKARPDRNGNLYLADCYNHRVRKVDTAGIITTVAGNGGSYCCDGMPATAAGISAVVSVAVDTAGNLYICVLGLSGTPLIRKIDTAGIITTFAGGGLGGDGSPATAALLHGSSDVAVDRAGNVYICEPPGYIRKVNTMGIISTVAGNGMSGFSGDGGQATLAQLYAPYGVAVDDTGNIYIGDLSNKRVRKVDTAGIITTIAGNGSVGYSGDGGPATAAMLHNPKGVAVDNMGNVFIADAYNCRVRKVTGGIITTVAGDSTYGHTGDGGPATAASLWDPCGIALDNTGNIFIADRLNFVVRKISAPPHITTKAETAAIITNALQVYPNPNDGSFTVCFSSGIAGPAQITITNAAGKKVKGYTSPANKETKIHLAAPPGIYFINAATKQGNWSSTMAIE